MIITANNTRICVIPRVENTDEELAEAIKKATQELGSEKVILIREDVKVLDANTVLDHKLNYYLAEYE